MEQKSNSALIGSIVIIVILVVGGFYLYNKTMQEKAQTEKTNAVVQDKALNDIENSLNTTNLDNIDKTI